VSSLIFTGFFSDRYGRKRLLVIKTILLTVLLVVLIILGLIGSVTKEVVIALYFFSLAFATLSFDVSILGLESITKPNRDNFIILLSATRIIGVGLLCMLFYLLSTWVYPIIVIGGMVLILLPLNMKFLHESPHFILASSGSIDMCKYIINSIADVNDEEPIQDKIAFSYS
jgi:MFS family permease